MLRYPSSYVRLGIMCAIPREAIGLEYSRFAVRTGAREGSYNLTIIGAIACAAALVGHGGHLYRALAFGVVVSLAVAFALDDEPISKKVSLLSLPGQLWSYARLSVGVAKDAAGYLVATFLAFIFLAPAARAYGLWHGWAYVAAYALLLGVRSAYAIWLLSRARERWEARLPPFTVRKGNLRSVRRAVKHVVWSFFVGNVGLAVRCGKQVALLSAFAFLAGTFPEHVAARWPHAWVLGGILAMAVVYRHGALLDALYYKIHRTLHVSSALYSGLHRIHHKAVLPTILDAGTESPGELLLTEYAAPVHVLLPSWLFFLAELTMFVGHFEGHRTRPLRGADGKTYLDAHIDHHRLVSFNFSCGSEPDPPETARALPILVEPEGQGLATSTP